MSRQTYFHIAATNENNAMQLIVTAYPLKKNEAAAAIDSLKIVGLTFRAVSRSEAVKINDANMRKIWNAVHRSYEIQREAA